MLDTRTVDLFGSDCLGIKVISLLVCLHSWLLPTTTARPYQGVSLALALTVLSPHENVCDLPNSTW